MILVHSRMTMAKAVGMGTIWIDGYELLRLIDSVVNEELPVDKTWAAGLKYSKRLIKNMMGVNENDGEAEKKQECK